MGTLRVHEKPLLTMRAGAVPPARSLAYLATPYTLYKPGLEAAFREASRVAGQILLAGIDVFSPIAHAHAISAYSEIDPLAREFWLAHLERFMERCDVLIIAEMAGWKESEGMNREIAFFVRARKHIFQLDPSSMIMRKVVGAGT